jgi:uncharacterized protein
MGIVSLLTMTAALAAAEDLTVSDSPSVQSPQIVIFDRGRLLPVGDKIRIASYNLQDFTDGISDGDQRTQEQAKNQANWAAASLSEIDPDIVLLDEVENDGALILLNERMKEPYPLACITRFAWSWLSRDKLNIALLSRVPVENLRELDFEHLSGKARPPRGVLTFSVDLGGNRRLLVYGVHLKSNYGSREMNQLKRRNALFLLRRDAADVVARSPKRSWEVLVAGDMNTDPANKEFADDITLQPLKGWVDLWRGAPLPERVTLPTRLGDPAQLFPPATFDRFFASSELTTRPWSAERPNVLHRGTDTNDIFTLPGQNGHISDHYPVWVDLVR